VIANPLQKGNPSELGELERGVNQPKKLTLLPSDARRIVTNHYSSKILSQIVPNLISSYEQLKHKAFAPPQLRIGKNAKDGIDYSKRCIAL
jgi:hypothetical protein